ncbi:baseplate wedge subunit [Acinetobacter phage Acj9]|uniref:Baseplate wedge protein gp10 n=1 Tax=Acinetobacter phage Acj9 TaxID=760939 RepID=E5EPV1_9CAUD|nr:baseplate wedge subunit [Acinetobacter phage Acj9]ADG60067.1 gp10 baseplate wedge subunit and tail pin protein [Acinetobacter phage Acj9]
MKEILNIGEVVDDGTGDYLRAGGEKIKNNFDDTYNELGDGNRLFPAGAWDTIESSKGNVLDAAFGKSYAIDTTGGNIHVKLPKGSVADYNKPVKIRDTFGTWQANGVTVSPAIGDTLKGSGDSQLFATNLQDLEFVYCAPGRWEFNPNKLLNRTSSESATSVYKKEFLCTEGQTDFIDVFGTADFNLINTQVYHRGNMLYYGTDFSDNSDFGSPGTGSDIVKLDGRSIRLRDPAKLGDSVVITTYVDGVSQWRSTYNRLDCMILDDKLTDEQSLDGTRLVADLATLDSITVEQLGYTQSSNSGLINPNTFEVYRNGVILNESGNAGLPLYKCEGADAKTNTDCQALGGTWTLSNIDYSYTVSEDTGSIESIQFGTPFEHGDVVTIKWFNNDIGTTLEIDEIIDETDNHYIQRGPTYQFNGRVRLTDFENPAWPNVEPAPETQVRVSTPADIFDIVYPVGTIYENGINPNNPATYMLGTWMLWGTRRVLVGWTDDINDTQFGLNNNDIDSNGNPTHTAGGTGGARTATITNDHLPATQTDEKVLIADNNGSVIVGGCQFDPDDQGPAYNKYREDYAKTNSQHVPPKALSTLDPYVTVYRWMRIL